MTEIERLLDDVVAGHRLTVAEGALLFRRAPLASLGAAANAVREARTDARVVTYVVDRNINYTNVCNVYCTFCAFYRPPATEDLRVSSAAHAREGHRRGEAYTLSVDEIVRKVGELVALGGTQVLLQGGLNPALRLSYVEEVFRAVTEAYPSVDLHSLTATEVEFFAAQEKLSIDETIGRLRKAGWKSLPGGGMEILVDRVRDKVSPLKTSAQAYLDIHRACHRAGMTTTATMMFGMVETIEERFEHFEKLRALQDATRGFTAFIPWTFQTDGSTPLRRPPPTSDEYLRVVALSRLFLDNFDHVQSGWVTEGARVAQAALAMGADDWGGILMEENVISAAGTLFSMSPANARRYIRECGYVPAQRDTYYRTIRRFEEEPEEPERLPARLTLVPGQRRVLAEAPGRPSREA